jgi:predicted O-methyltransferase YrrM
MNTETFLEQLSSSFDGPVRDGAPADPRFHELTESVAGFTTAAELALLNAAARALPEGESYLEVGTFKGRSLVAALLDAPDRQFVAVENFQEFGMVGRDARTELETNLAKAVQGHRVRLVDGDCFKVLRDSAVAPRDVGVYFYDGAHTGLAHWLALAVVEPLLADEALVVIDDASWPMVRAATDRYVDNRDGWDVLLDLPASKQDDPVWANGLLLLRFRRPAGAVRRHPGVEWRRRLQIHVRAPATSLIWRSLHRFPALVPLAKAVVPKRSRAVPGSEAPQV